MSRIFLSHSSANNGEAVALRDWLEQEGWKGEVFLDLDPVSGIAPGERWERKLNEAANRCEAVLFLLSKAWISSDWCRRELHLAHHLNKRLFGVLIEDLPITDVPKDLTGDWQLVRLASGRDGILLRTIIPITQTEMHVTFSAEGLKRLKHGLEAAGLDPKYFSWPPTNDPNRPPYRGLRPLESDDAGIFFGRDAPVIEALDRLRGLRETTPPRLVVILGASGAGKSSFLRAGLLPRLLRDDRHFLPLPIIRPERAAITGTTGLLYALEQALKTAKTPLKRTELRSVIEGGAVKVRPLLQSLTDKGAPSAFDHDVKLKPPTLIVTIDQGEELFLAEGLDEAKTFLALLRELLDGDAPALIVLFTIRSDVYERLQLAKELEGVRQDTLSLPPMPKGSYSDVIKGPVLRLMSTERKLEIEESLVNALLTDIDAGGAKDALPLLAFTLERLYVECGGSGRLTLADYEALGRIKGSIEAAVERAFQEADNDPAIPKDRNARLALLRHGLIPWLAGIDTDTGSPRRRVARKSEIPAQARPLIECLIDQRLLTTDVSSETRDPTIEPVHEALLRQWGLLQSWLSEDAALLGIMEGVKRAARDWAANRHNAAWLTHSTDRLEAAERLRERADLAANLEKTDWDYLEQCRKHENKLVAEAKALQQRTTRMRAAISILFVGVLAGLSYLAWSSISYMKVRTTTVTDALWPKTLALEFERSLKPGDIFKECSYCPEMIVVPAGEYTMGSPPDESHRNDDEGPTHKVRIARQFAVGRFALTFDEWDACAILGGCSYKPGDAGWGRGLQPVINVNWDDAKAYLEWLSGKTRKNYRLLSEAEWEYVARAGSITLFWWGTSISPQQANYDGRSTYGDGPEGAYRKRTLPVQSFHPNPWGLYQVHGNVWQWTEDCYHKDYRGAPDDGTAWTSGDCNGRVLRGGSWVDGPSGVRAAVRGKGSSIVRYDIRGIRVARTLNAP